MTGQISWRHHWRCRPCPDAGRIRRYADKNTEPIILLATGYAWLTAMLIIALVPIDVWATLDGESTTAISVFWNIAYWWVRPARRGAWA